MRRRDLLRWGVATALTSTGAVTGAAFARETRLVSVGGGVTETLVALGAEDLIVGVDTTSTFPERLRHKPQVGYQHALPVEGIVALRPQAIVHDGSAGPDETLRRLERAGVRNWVLPDEPSWAGLAARIEWLGERLDRAEAARALVAQLDAQRAALPAPPEQPPRVLFVMSHGPGSVVAAGRDTKADALLRLAGCRNVLAETQSGYRPVSIEGIHRLDPAGIVIAGDPDAALSQRLGRRPVLREDTLKLLGFGPRLPEAVGAVLAFARDISSRERG